VFSYLVICYLFQLSYCPSIHVRYNYYICPNLILNFPLQKLPSEKNYCALYMRKFKFVKTFCVFKIYITIILPVVLYVCETLSLALREEHKLRVFENRVMRICGTKWKEMVEGWRRLHNEELRNLYASPNIIKMFESKTMS
jgi:hypothetical protein